MRKIYNSIMLIAAVAMASLSCQKQENAGGTDGPVVKMSVIASLDDVTRTSVAPVSGGYSVSWSAGDKIKILETLGGELTANVVNSDALAADADVASFSATLAVIQGTGFTYCAVYPSTAYSTGGTDTKFCRVNLPDAQTFTTAGFDPKADLLLGEARPYETQPSEVKLNFNRIGGTALMTLTGITEGEEISKIEISTTETNIAGYYKIDETTGMVIVPQMGSPVYSGSKTITLTCADELCAVASIPVWFRIAAAKLVEDFTVKVTTDKAIYDKTIDLAGSGKNIEFKDGFLTKFTVDLSGSREAISTAVYNLVTDASDLSEGDEVIIVAAESAVAMSKVQNTNNRGEVEITKSGTTVVAGNDVQVFTLEAGTETGSWAFYTGEKYLAAVSSNNNYLRSIDDKGGNSSWAISIADGVATVVAQGIYSRKYMQYNSGSSIFSCYSSASQKAISLYKLAGSTPKLPLDTPEVDAAVDDDEKYILVSWTDVNNAVKYIVSCTGQESQEVDPGEEGCFFTDLPAGTYTVTVTAVGAEGYKNSSASVSDLVITSSTPAPSALTTMDQIFAAATEAGSTEVTVAVTFDNWVVSGVAGSNVYITDGSKGFIDYKSGHGFEVGDKLSGTVEGLTLTLYKGAAEFNNLTSTSTGLTVTKGGALTPQAVSISDLSGVNTGAVIDLGLLTYNGSAFTDGTNTITPYTSLYSYDTLIKDKKYEVKGVYLQYNSTREILPRSAEDLVMEVSTEPEIYSVSPDALTFTATETTAKTVTITGANLTKSNVTLSLNNSDFTAQFGADAYTVDVAPKAANTSTTADKTATLTITVGSVSKTVSLTQSKAATVGDKTFEITSDAIVSNSSYKNYEGTVDNRGWIITFGGNNKSVGTNSGNRSKCTLANYSKYAVSPVTTSDIASAFASTTKIDNVKAIKYTIGGGSNQTSTNVYLIYSSDGNTFSQISLKEGTQGAAISSGTEFEFEKCSGYFALVFKATNSSGNWRIDDVKLTFTYE